MILSHEVSPFLHARILHEGEVLGTRLIMKPFPAPRGYIYPKYYHAKHLGLLKIED